MNYYVIFNCPMPLKLYFYSLLVTTVFSFCLGAFVLYKKPSCLVNQTWFLTSLAVSNWSFFLSRNIFAVNFAESLLSAKLCNISAAYIPVFFTHFCIALTNHSSRSRKFVLTIGYINTFVITLFGFSDSFLSVRPISVFPYFTAAGTLYHFFTVHFFSYFLISEAILLQSLRRLTYEMKNQIKFVIVATTCGFIAGGFTFLPAYGIPINPVPGHLVWLYAAIISYAIIKHHLMDINLIFRKSLIYSALIGAITSIYFLLVYLISGFLQDQLGYRSLTSVVLIFTIITFIFKPLETKIQEFIDLLIFKKTPDMIKKENLQLLGEVRKQDRMKAISTLAAGMAHEIKNPMTSIKTFAEYLPQKYNDPEFRSKFQRIVADEVDRVNHIVGQVLEFAKPTEPELKPVSAPEILDETLNMLNNSFITHKIDVLKSYPAIPPILADKKQLKQVFLNVFLNSIQAMPSGGTLKVSTSLLNGADGRVAISIQDTGHGIKPEDLPRIFEPFFTTKESGTGLGLSIVHGIVKEHGGDVKVESRLNEGTTVSVILKNAA